MRRLKTEPCETPGCDSVQYCQSLCKAHYQAKWREANAERERTKRPNKWERVRLLKQGLFRCGSCLETKPVAEFPKDPTSRYGISHNCGSCRRAGAKSQRDLGRQHQRVMKRFGFTPERYAKLLATQGGVCPLCDRSPQEVGKRLCIDHDHATDLVRGLLCQRCNMILGHLEQMPEFYLRALAYMREPPYSQEIKE